MTNPPDVTIDIIDRLATERARFRGFLTKRLGNEADADDLLQQNLLTLLRRSAGPRDREHLTAWFYRVLRRALIDHARSESARQRREQAWSEEAAWSRDDRTLHQTVCGCMAGVIDTLPPPAAEMLRRVDLQEFPIATVAGDLGITVNAATVRLHRARRALRTKLEEFCGECAKDKCRDCGCTPNHGR